MNNRTSLETEKPLSRQRQWQLAMKAAGKCTLCAKPADGRNLCVACGEKASIARRNAYRTKVGIPLDAPLDGRGRKRKHVTSQPA